MDGLNATSLSSRDILGGKFISLFLKEIPFLYICISLVYISFFVFYVTLIFFPLQKKY